MKLNTPSSDSRRYDIDWLRVITIGLLLIYHTSIGFQPWGALIRFVQNAESLESLWILMSMMNIWRIPILFCISGMGVWFALRSRNWKTLITERSTRILLPFLVGIFLWVPLHVNIWQQYYAQPLWYSPQSGHLWFLGNIFLYTLVLSPIFFYLKRHSTGKVTQVIQGVFEKPLGLVIITIPFVLESILIRPESFELYAMTWHGFVLGAIAFLIGFLGAFVGEGFWKNLNSYKWITGAMALTAYSTRVLFFELRTPDFLMSIESCLWIYAILGWSYQYLNRPGKVLSYLSEAAYPIYIVHMIFLYLGSVLIFPLNLSAAFKLILLLLFTLSTCFLSYEFGIRRISFLRPLFGLKVKKQIRMETAIQSG